MGVDRFFEASRPRQSPMAPMVERPATRALDDPFGRQLGQVHIGIEIYFPFVSGVVFFRHIVAPGYKTSVLGY
jgi:hypothetical protein